MNSSRGIIFSHLPKMLMQSSQLLFMTHQYFSIAFWTKSKLFDRTFLRGFPTPSTTSSSHFHTTSSSHIEMLDAP